MMCTAIENIDAPEGVADVWRWIRREFGSISRLIAGSDTIFVAAVNGAAAGIGLAWALTCDLVIASERAVIVPAFGKLGLISEVGTGDMIPTPDFAALMEASGAPPLECSRCSAVTKAPSSSTRSGPVCGLCSPAITWRCRSSRPAVHAEEAIPLVHELTAGVMADRVVLTPSVLHAVLLSPALMLTRKSGACLMTAVPKFELSMVALSLVDMVQNCKHVKGLLYGGMNPRASVPMLLSMYRNGHLKLDELVTRRYRLDQINDADDGLVAEDYHFMDVAGLLTQLGVTGG